MGLGFVAALVKFHSPLGFKYFEGRIQVFQQGLGPEHRQNSRCLTLLYGLVNSFTNCISLSALLSTHQLYGCWGVLSVFQPCPLIFCTSGDIFLPHCPVPSFSGLLLCTKWMPISTSLRDLSQLFCLAPAFGILPLVLHKSTAGKNYRVRMNLSVIRVSWNSNLPCQSMYDHKKLGKFQLVSFYSQLQWIPFFLCCVSMDIDMSLFPRKCSSLYGIYLGFSVSSTL